MPRARKVDYHKMDRQFLKNIRTMSFSDLAMLLRVVSMRWQQVAIEREAKRRARIRE